MALLGTALGALLGVCLGWAISVTLRQDSLTKFNIPLTSLAVIVGVGAIGGVLAAVRPGWRAAHLDVIRAIATD